MWFSCLFIFITYSSHVGSQEAPTVNIAYQNADTGFYLSEEEQQWLRDHPVVRLGYDQNWAPYDFQDVNGEFQGISSDILQIVEQRLGIRFDAASQKEWQNTLTLAKNNEIDMLSAISATEERGEYLHFSIPYFTPRLVMYSRRDAPSYFDLEDLSGKIVAVENAYYLYERLSNEYPEITLYIVDTTEEAITAVSHGSADAYVGNQGATDWVIEKNALTNLKVSSVSSLGKASLRFAIRKDWDVLQALIDRAITSISEAEMSQIRRKWLGVSSTTTDFYLSEDERQWLKENDDLQFVGDPNWLPYEAFDSDGNYVGIVAEHLKLIESMLGINIEVIPTDSWAESLSKIEAKEVDIISETANSNLVKNLPFTNAYVTSPIVIIMRDEEDYIANLGQIKDKKIALVKNYGYAPEVIGLHPEIEFFNVNSVQEGLTATSVGEVDALLATLAQASYYISLGGINNVRIVGKTDATTSLAFGIQPELEELVPLFDRALTSISETQQQAIFKQWGKQQFSVKTDYTLLTIIASFLLLIIAIVVYWNRKLGKEIEHRNELERQTAAIIDFMPVQVTLTDRNGNVIAANPIALDYYQIKKEDVKKYHVSDFLFSQDDYKLILKEIADQGRVDQKLFKFNKPNDEPQTLMLSVIPITYDKTKLFLCISVDITARLKIEEALKESIQAAKEANAAKSLFLANMSHEIRTPMNAIMGYTELLHDNISDRKLKSFAKIIQKAGNNLLVLINDILDLSKIEAKRLDIDLRPCNIHKLIEEVADIFAVNVSEKGLILVLDIDTDIPESLLLDYTRLRQVLFNLVGNAVKFTRKGQVKLSARIDEATNEDETLNLSIHVEDTGIGISNKHHELIFEKFSQSQGQDVREFKGTGLGLAISKRLVELMGGELSVDSQIGEGSCFSVELHDVKLSSQQAVMELSSDVQDVYQFASANILVVDDVLDNSSLLMEYFANTNLTVTVANNGKDAVELAHMHEFDIVLMDIRMPEMDGYEASEKIKAKRNVPIIALTASVMIDEFEKLSSSNFDGYLRKPVFKNSLFKELSRFLEVERYSKSDVLVEEKLSVSEAEIPLVREMLPALSQLSDDYSEIEKMSNIDDIISFSAALDAIHPALKVALIDEYRNELRVAIDAFDIAKIKQCLAEFNKLLAALHSSAE